jgi:hypothetical protein
MGYLHAIEFAEGDLDTGLTWHLRSNHFPPIPLTMLEPCKAAIDFCNNGNMYGEIALPEGVTYKGQTTAPAWVIVEQHHLDAWIEYSKDDLEAWLDGKDNE